MLQGGVQGSAGGRRTVRAARRPVGAARAAPVAAAPPDVDRLGALHADRHAQTARRVLVGLLLSR